MAQRLLANPKVMPVWNSVVEEVLGDIVTNAATGEKLPHMTGVRVKNVISGDTSTVPAAGLFVAIGHTPNTKFLKGQLEVDSLGFVVLKEPFRTTTSVEGVFAAGDVADPTYKQAITAAGMGCKAALDAERWLAAQNIH
jgi:thioredoxin reductase (NADPH)